MHKMHERTIERKKCNIQYSHTIQNTHTHTLTLSHGCCVCAFCMEFCMNKFKCMYLYTIYWSVDCGAIEETCTVHNEWRTQTETRCLCGVSLLLLLLLWVQQMNGSQSQHQIHCCVLYTYTYVLSVLLLSFVESSIFHMCVGLTPAHGHEMSIVLVESTLCTISMWVSVYVRLKALDGGLRLLYTCGRHWRYLFRVESTMQGDQSIASLAFKHVIALWKQNKNSF